MATPEGSKLPHYPVDLSRYGEPLTFDEFATGYTETTRLIGAYAANGDVEMSRWMDAVADQAVDDNPDHYIHLGDRDAGAEVHQLRADLDQILDIEAGLRQIIGNQQ